MKFKEQRGSVFVFDGGYAGGELEVLSTKLDGVMTGITYKGVVVWNDMDVDTLGTIVPYRDIQTAVNLMQILIDEGLV
jgi:hypothetical protein